ncbi:dienelactone hydrolase family protein [Conyzicola nivalis]|uniref:Phospholipase/carboxylesterase n=1 Tax=Conyzicola nivalis TaxID=1477021 RepID=A0A916WMA5_9MICO|nr:alpha/beta hydrolase-fold protein [Conyzicola nivalis]GGB11383.1 phospholipase/carboxylesterase [Conyzicola nivalis]
MVTIDPSAVIWSAPERERAGRPLLVLLHGFGSHEGDLFGLSPQLPLGPVIASLRAPLDAGQGGFAWAPLSRQADAATVAKGADEVAVALLEWLATTESTSVGLLGFSQGAAVAMQLLRNAPERFAFAVNLSGFAVPDDNAGDAELARVSPPVFWGRGTADQVITPDLIAYTQQWLPEHSTLTERIYEDLPHSISRPELDDVNAFIRSVWR